MNGGPSKTGASTVNSYGVRFDFSLFHLWARRCNGQFSLARMSPYSGLSMGIRRSLHTLRMWIQRLSLWPNTQCSRHQRSGVGFCCRRYVGSVWRPFGIFSPTLIGHGAARAISNSPSVPRGDLSLRRPVKAALSIRCTPSSHHVPLPLRVRAQAPFGLPHFCLQRD